MRKKGFKTTRRYRLTFVSENTLNSLWTLRMSRTRAWLFGAVCVAAVSALVALLLGLTPLGSILPGYMRPDQRRVQVANGLRLDSLIELQAVQTAWIGNVRAILTGEVDSVVPAENVPAVVDTLLSASAAERRFVDEWTERERYNLSVVTPVVASSMSFRAPVQTVLRRDSVGGTITRIESTRHATVSAIHSGTVLDAHLDVASGRWIVIMQHPNEFVSRYEGLKQCFVTMGQRLPTGGALGQLGSDGRLELMLWRSGLPLHFSELL